MQPDFAASPLQQLVEADSTSPLTLRRTGDTVDDVVAAVICKRGLGALGVAPVTLASNDSGQGVAIGPLLAERRPTLSRAHAAWEACSQLVDVDALAWLACLGGDTEESFGVPFGFRRTAGRLATGKYLRRARHVVHMAVHSLGYHADLLSDVLLSADHPRDLFLAAHQAAAALVDAAAEVDEALLALANEMPSPRGPLALLRVQSRVPVETLLLRSWTTRLPRQIVLVANEHAAHAKVRLAVGSCTRMRPQDFLDSLPLPRGLHLDADKWGLRGECERDAWPALVTALGF